jgi:hypothetical protein
MGKPTLKSLDPRKKEFWDPSGFFLSDDAPKPPKPPSIPDPGKAQAQAAEAAAEELRRRRKGGRGSTILTGALETPAVAKKTLLGQ